jgi:hypothetical protein
MLSNNGVKKKKSFKFMSKHGTYEYLKDQYKKGNRIVVSRYGDGEYLIMLGRKKKKGIAGQEVTKELTRLLNESIKKKKQLICTPNKIIITEDNLYLDEDNERLSNKIGRYIISNSEHSLYGQVQWRDVDLMHYNSEFLTEFFIGKTLVITGHKEVCEKAFYGKKVRLDVYGIPMKNAAGDYENIKSDLISVSKEYKNIVFAAGPIAKVLIADLVDKCKAHLIDIGSSIGVIINPYSITYQVVRYWPNTLRKKDLKIVKNYSDKFFKTLNKKI